MGRDHDRPAQLFEQRSSTERLESLKAPVAELREQRILVLHNRDREPGEREEPPRASVEATGDPRSDAEGMARSVARALVARGHFVEVQCLDSGDLGELIRQLQTDPPDLVFNLIQSLGESARHELLLPGLLDLLAVPYTGSGSLTLGLCGRRHHLRQLLRGAGLPLLPWAVLAAGQQPRAAVLQATAELTYPLLIKPAHEDFSAGSGAWLVARGPDELLSQVERLRDRSPQPLVVEQFLDGRDLQITLLGSEPLRTLPVQELSPESRPTDRLRIVTPSHATPGLDAPRPEVAAPLSRTLRERVEQLAHKCFLTLELCDYGRCDIRLAADGKPYVVEVHPSCDLTTSAALARAGQLAGLSYDALIEQIALSALKRHARKRRGASGHSRFPNELAG